MKKIIAACCLLGVFLCGCTEQYEEAEPQTTTSSTTSDYFDQIALDAAEARAEYYQGLVAELQKEIVSMKNAHASAKVEYESRIDELEAALGMPHAAPASDFQYTTKDGKITITSYIGTSKTVSIPDKIGDCAVTQIADAAFENHTKLEKIILPSGLEKIGWFAFRGCIALREVEIPNSVSKIEYGAFENCNSALMILCGAGSYAEQYAQSYGYTTQKQ